MSLIRGKYPMSLILLDNISPVAGVFAFPPSGGVNGKNITPDRSRAAPNLGGNVLKEKSKSGDVQILPRDMPDAPSNIPPETWAVLQSAGHAAAVRLLDLIEAPGFSRLKPADQARLIELALTRAHGAPLARSASVALSGTITDAVADSLATLSGHDLPEYAQSRQNGPPDSQPAPAGGVGSQATQDGPQRPRQRRPRFM